MSIQRAQPLPECTADGCGAPMRRQDWHTAGGRCSEHRTGVQAIAAAHQRVALARAERDRTAAQAAAAARAQDRIERLAARRAARASGSVGGGV